jgi:hypothetical protein
MNEQELRDALMGIRRAEMKETVVFIPSMTEPEKEYKVDLVLNECTCRGFKFRKECGHLELAKL